MKKLFLSSFVLLSVLLLSACSNGFKADYKLAIEPFEFTSHKNEKVSLEDLKGEVWLGQFVFTNCTTVCGPMMMNMIKLQDALEEAGVEPYKIVSFSVDPVVDKPAVLTTYLDQFNPADPDKWLMLTGYKQAEIAEIAKKSFATLVVDDPNSDQVTHGISFYLVDQKGRVVKMYNGVENVNIEEIVKDTKSLIKHGPI